MTPISWETATADAIGGRTEQQDRVAVFPDSESGAVLAVVADGLGGHAGGAAAAQLVVDVAREHWDHISKPVLEPEHLLTDICFAVHRRIVALAEETGRDGRSTCAFLYGDSSITAWLHVGDSRIYRFQGPAPAGRTRDHSLIQRMLDRGDITEADMANHPDQNKLLEALGGDCEPRPDVASAKAEDYDGFLLCTDGLWEAITPDEMGRAIAERPLATVARELADVASQRRGPTSDNIAVALVRAGQGRRSNRPRFRRRILAALAVPLLIMVLLAVGVFYGRHELANRQPELAKWYKGRLASHFAKPAESEEPKPVQSQQAPGSDQPPPPK